MRKNRTGGPRLTTGGQPKGRRMVATFPLRQLPNPGHNPGASESIDWTIRLVCHDEEIIVRLQVRAQRTPRRSEGRNSNRGKMLRAVPGHGRDEASLGRGRQRSSLAPKQHEEVRGVPVRCEFTGNATLGGMLAGMIGAQEQRARTGTSRKSVLTRPRRWGIARGPTPPERVPEWT